VGEQGRKKRGEQEEAFAIGCTVYIRNPLKTKETRAHKQPRAVIPWFSAKQTRALGLSAGFSAGYPAQTIFRALFAADWENDQALGDKRWDAAQDD
jgi:hypothetical protein